MSSFAADVTAPEDAILNRIEELIRNGYPGVTREGEPWLSGEPAPYGHWLMPVGSGLYRYEDPVEVEAPGVLLGFSDSAVPRVDRDARLWDVFPRVDVIWQNDCDRPGWMLLCAALTRLLISDGLGAAGESRARDRLTGPGVRVFDVRRYDMDPLTETSGRPMHSIGMNAFCAGVAPEV